MAATRRGAEVEIRFTIPTTNRDGLRPADLARVDVYAFTAATDDPIEFVKEGTLVGSVLVKPPPPEPPEGQGRSEPASPVPVDEAAGFDQGAVAVVREVLAGDAVRPRESRAAKIAAEARNRRRPADRVIALPLWWPTVRDLPRRYYAAVGVSPRGRIGAVSERVAIPLFDPPAPPTDVTVTYTEQSVTVTWKPPAGPPRPILSDPPAPPPGRLVPIGELLESLYNPPPPPLASTSLTPSLLPVAYNVYETAPGQGDGPTKPLNEGLLGTPSYTDTRVVFGTERCFQVRSVMRFLGVAVESEPARAECVTLVDTFAPAAPAGLGAVASEGAISLIWEPNGEADLAGYLVLRGEAPGEKLQPLTPEPIRETSYRDASVKPGVSYVYAVVAVDSATPPNVSKPSNRVEERAR